ncbi:MAG TPA: hypothetical protein VGM37_11030 [Armatimonadota bacterium]
MAPFQEWSPLLHARAAQRRFTDWCAQSTVAATIINDALADSPVYELGGKPDEFVLSVDYDEAVNLVRALVNAYEDEALERLFSR